MDHKTSQETITVISIFSVYGFKTHYGFGNNHHLKAAVSRYLKFFDVNFIINQKLKPLSPYSYFWILQSFNFVPRFAHVKFINYQLLWKRLFLLDIGLGKTYFCI